MAGERDDGRERNWRPATAVVLAGRDPFDQYGFVNTPIYRGSTVLSRTVADFTGKRGRYVYGRRGTPTTESLATAITALEGGAGTALTSSGLSAITTALMSVARAGDHVLVADTVYGPTRHFCDTILAGYGIEIGYYDPLAGGAIAEMFRQNTRAVFIESPGSLSFEIAGCASHRRGRASARRCRIDGQHLGDAGLFPAPRFRCRSFDSSRHKISRRARGREPRHDFSDK
jgi:cysteine-S-conjugate beta-lyase